MHWNYFLAAIMFYTRIPVPAGTGHSDQILNRSRLYFPLIGYLIGLIAVTAFAVGSLFLPTSLSVLISIMASVLATGAFHEDGFADSCDGFGGGWDADQVLHIMKDSRVGSYATVGLLLLLSLKFYSLYELSQLAIIQFALVYICAHTLSRLFSSLLIERYSYVQDIDLSKVKPITDRHLPARYLILTVLIGLAPLLLLTFSFPYVILAAGLSALSALAVGHYSNRRIGGYTGDVLGAAQQVSEVVFYICLVSLLSR